MRRIPMDESRPLLVTCQYCQAQSPPEAVHCPNCGQPLPRHLLLQGERVCDDYHIVRLIGYGGMGEVYLAQHHLTGQQVAIKVLAFHLAEEMDLRIRFLDEARILARLDHPNIVMLHNFKQERERMHIIMQYVDGESLDRIIERKGAMDSEQAALLFAPLADALHHAHGNGIIHRDIKPSNILVNETGKARLTDFGIAKLTEGGANLTRTGTRVGTSWFMSPEQGLNKPADSRSDIYALAVTLYNGLSGRLPFSGDSEYEVIKGHVELPPPPIFSGDDPLDRDVEAVVMQGLAKDPDERFQTGSAMRDALLEVLAAHGETVDLRATSNGAGVVALPKRLVAGSPGGAAPPPLPPGVEAAHPPTTLDPVEELDEIPSLLPTPPLGSVTREGADADEGASRLTSEEPNAVPMPTHPPASRSGGAVEPGRLQTPSGRPPAPGMSNAATGVMLREEAEAVAEPPAKRPVTRERAVSPPVAAETAPAEPTETTPAEPTETTPAEPTETTPAEPTETAQAETEAGASNDAPEADSDASDPS
jgi:serine/threonine-protein kinase